MLIKVQHQKMLKCRKS